jgi:hypothetical protein
VTERELAVDLSAVSWPNAGIASVPLFLSRPGMGAREAAHRFKLVNLSEEFKNQVESAAKPVCP